MIKNLNKRIFLILLVIFMISLSSFIFFILFLEKKTENVASLNKQVIEARSENVLELKQNLQKLDSQIVELESYFVDNKNIVSFLEEIEYIGEQVGILVEIQNVELTDVSRNKKTEVDGKIQSSEVRTSGELSLSLQTKGDWSNIMAFIKILEKIDKKSKIEGLRLSATVNPETKQNYWNALFNIKVLTN